MLIARLTLLTIDTLMTAAIAGFFYAYSSSVMIGFDAASPHAAIEAMQAINATIRNPIFAPAFFGPAIVGFGLALAYGVARCPPAWFARGAFLTYLIGGFLLTLSVNLPMNDGLASSTIPTNPEAARLVWITYSEPWTWWNTVRTIASFVSLALLLAAFAAEMRGTGGPAQSALSDRDR